MLKEQSWLIPFLIFPTRETEPAKWYFFPSASKNLLLLPLYTSHYHPVLSKSHFAAPSEGKSIFWKISCHSVVFTGSLYHFSKIHFISVPFECFCLSHRTEMAVLFRICVIHAYWVTSNLLHRNVFYIPDCEDCTLKAVSVYLVVSHCLGLGAYGLWTLHLFNFCTRSRIRIMY